MSEPRTTEILSGEFVDGWSATLIASTTVAAMTCDVVAATKTVTRAAGSFVSEGIAVGDILTFTGFADAGNNIDYTVVTVSALTLTGTSAAAMTNVTADGGVQYVPSTKCVHIGKGRFNQLRVNTAIITVTPKDGTAALWGTLTSAADFNAYCASIGYSNSLKLTFSADGNAWVFYKASV